MANIDETGFGSTFPSTANLILDNEAVVGAPNAAPTNTGIANLAHIDLAKRTQFLKQNNFNKVTGDIINGGYTNVAINDNLGDGNLVKLILNGTLVAKSIRALIDESEKNGVVITNDGKIVIGRGGATVLDDMILPQANDTLETATTKAVLGIKTAFHSGGTTGLHISARTGTDPTKPRIGLLLDGSLDFFKDKNTDIWTLIGDTDIIGKLQITANLTVVGNILNGDLDARLQTKIKRTGDIMSGDLDFSGAKITMNGNDIIEVKNFSHNGNTTESDSFDTPLTGSGATKRRTFTMRGAADIPDLTPGTEFLMFKFPNLLTDFPFTFFICGSFVRLTLKKLIIPVHAFGVETASARTFIFPKQVGVVGGGTGLTPFNNEAESVIVGDTGAKSSNDGTATRNQSPTIIIDDTGSVHEVIIRNTHTADTLSQIKIQYEITAAGLFTP